MHVQARVNRAYGAHTYPQFENTFDNQNLGIILYYLQMYRYARVEYQILYQQNRRVHE